MVKRLLGVVMAVEEVDIGNLLMAVEEVEHMGMGTEETEVKVNKEFVFYNTMSKHNSNKGV